jgi:hypothetical protein
MTFEEMEHALRQWLQALPSAARAELLHVLHLPDLQRVERIGEFGGYPETRTFGELLIDLEEDKAARSCSSLAEMEWNKRSVHAFPQRPRTLVH